MNERETLKINNSGHLEIGGIEANVLRECFGTPLYVFDEAYIRMMMQIYRQALKDYYLGESLVLYASKAFSCMAIYAIARQEEIGVDVVSGGELYTALKAGFPCDKIYMHGNNKLTYELEDAVKGGVGTIVVDSYTEVDQLDSIALSYGKVQQVLIRVNPGVEAHTHAYIQTGKTDSKFGFSINDGTAENMVKYVLSKKNLFLAGFHCHIGSQIFEKTSFVVAAQKVMDFVLKLNKELNYVTKVLNIGGGFGIWYTDEDPKLTQEDYREYVELLAKVVEKNVSQNNLPLPKLVIEPGRSIIGEAGITLYTVGAIKDIPGVKKYVAIDGGMFDNPRYALYQSKYTVMLADRANEKATEVVSIAGKCCESGDLIAVDVKLPSPNKGDLMAVLSTGAYNYSMASNYNRNFIPAAVLVNNGQAEFIVKPQTYEDIIRNDAIPSYLKN